MTLKPQFLIMGERDSTTVRRNDDGSVFIGAMTLAPGELDKYIETIREAVKVTTEQNP